MYVEIPTFGSRSSYNLQEKFGSLLVDRGFPWSNPLLVIKPLMINEDMEHVNAWEILILSVCKTKIYENVKEILSNCVRLEP